MKLRKLMSACSAAMLLAGTLHGQTRYENTYTWFNADHSGWKGMSNFPDGYVIVGNKFFEPNNTTVYMTGFDDYSQHLFTTSHNLAPSGFTQLDVFWKSFTNIGSLDNPEGFFIVVSGIRNLKRVYGTLQTDKNGELVDSDFGPLESGVTFGGASQSNDGGYIAVGGNNLGDLYAVKFAASGEAVTSASLGINGFGWTVQPASGGGYVVGSTNARVTKIDENLNVEWTVTATLPPSPQPDGSSYTYTEFEEITPLVNAGNGFIMSGSAFSNSTSAAYTTFFDWNGTPVWVKINQATSTSQPGTPVCWTNSAVERFTMATGLWDILYTWRNGPVSAGGTLNYDHITPATGDTISSGSLQNAIPVQEAFTVRHNTDRIVVAGTRGGYSSVYSYATCNLPGEADITPPVVVCPDNITRPTDPYENHAVVNFTVEVQDNCDQHTVAECSPPSGSTFPIGDTVVTCTATDSVDNTGSCSFTVEVFEYDVTLQDDNFPARALRLNSTTGDYIYCCDGEVSSGFAKVRKNGCRINVSLRNSEVVLQASIDQCRNRGTASLRVGRSRCRIKDTNILNNNPVCP